MGCAWGKHWVLSKSGLFGGFGEPPSPESIVLGKDMGLVFAGCVDGNNPPCAFSEASEPRFSYQMTELAAVGDCIGPEGGWRQEGQLEGDLVWDG